MDFIFTEKLLVLYCSCIGGDICENNYELFAYLVTVFLFGGANFSSKGIRREVSIEEYIVV